MKTARSFLAASGLWLILVQPHFAQSLTVVAPNDGQTVTLGIPYAIRWTSSGVTQPLRILLYRNGERVGTIASDVAVGGGSYSWVGGRYEGGTAPEGDGYSIRIRVIGVDLMDASDRPFALRPLAIVATGFSAVDIPPLRVDVPRGGERLAVGSRVDIRWTRNVPSEHPENDRCSDLVSISAVRQGDGRVTLIVSRRDNRPGANSYSWYILPPVFADLTGDYRIRITGTTTNCMAESGIFALTYDAAGDANPAGSRDEGPDPIDAAIQVQTDTFRSERIAGAPSMDSGYDAYRARMTVRAQITNRHPSGAPIEVRVLRCRWLLEENKNDGNGWNSPALFPTRWKVGYFEMGPLHSERWGGHEIVIEYKLPDDPANEWAGRARYRIRFDLDPDRTLPDPNRDNNIGYSPAFPNPRAQ